MTLRELFSEWSNPRELFRGAILSGVFCIVFAIMYFWRAESNNRDFLLYGALALAVLHVVCRFRLTNHQ